MIAAIATDGKHVSPHFGRCQAYTMVTIENGGVAYQARIANPGHAPGAIPDFLYQKGVKMIVCGGIGARAAELFGQYGIEIIAGVDASVEDAVDRLVKGTLVGGKTACKPGAGRGYGVEKTKCDHAHEKN